MSVHTEFPMQMVSQAVQSRMSWSVREDEPFCEVNLIIAGPLCSGKMPIVKFLDECFATPRQIKLNLMNQSSFYKPLSSIEKCELGYRIDTLEAFYVEDFKKKVKRLFDKGVTFSPYYNQRKWERGKPELEQQCLTEKQKKDMQLSWEFYYSHTRENINVFVGTHTISALEKIVPNCLTVYLNTDFDVCMKRRIDTPCYRDVANLHSKSNYYDFVREEILYSIAPQKDMADLVLKVNTI